MKWLLYPEAPAGKDSIEDAAALVRAGAFVPKLAAPSPARAIEELGHALRPALGDLVESAIIAVLERELVAPTGLGDGVAIPHAPVEGLSRPVVALGLAPDGIEFEAPDGLPARIVFLLLLPPKAYEAEVRVLAALARSVFDEPARTELLGAKTAEEATKCLDTHARRIGAARSGPRMSSLTDM
jgi:mannitol/fructose-specific phosphotransferase system IIA component (Ntr-type)